MKKILCFIFSLFLFFSLFAENEVESETSVQASSQSAPEAVEENALFPKQPFFGKSIFAFNFGYLGTGLKENGLSAGFSYEHQIYDYLSVKGGFSHMVMHPLDQSFGALSVGLRLDSLLYPFNRGLDWLYVGFGSSIDWVFYLEDNTLASKENDTVICIFPEIGWKQDIYDFVMLDIFGVYRILANPGMINTFAYDYVNSGFEYGVRVKVNFSRIWHIITRKR